jgi:serine/threonine protein kinase
MDWAKAVRLIVPVAEALHYAHQQGLIHRDIKPSNILMPRPDWPLLADFSLVKVHTSQTITDIGVVMGTPAYIPPEQAGGEKVDHRADMYSLGVVMFEMITGRLPFDYENPHLLMMAHLSEPVPSPRQFNPVCPPELEEIILTALRKDPAERCADVQIMINALRYVLNVSTAPFPSTPPASPDRPGQPSDAKSIAVSRGPIQEEGVAQIVLSAQNVTINLPEPQKGSLIIGRTHRDIQADIDLSPYGASDMGVSRQHARLTWQNGQWFIEDLGSLNGTYLNEVKLTPNTPASLKHNDVIRCSHLSFSFLISAEIRNEK